MMQKEVIKPVDVSHGLSSLSLAEARCLVGELFSKNKMF